MVGHAHCHLFQKVTPSVSSAGISPCGSHLVGGCHGMVQSGPRQGDGLLHSVRGNPSWAFEIAKAGFKQVERASPLSISYLNPKSM